MRHLVQAQLRSRWIEVLAIPVIASIMEAQPIFIVLLFISSLFANGAVATPILSEITIILLILGLRWWAMGVQAWRGLSTQNALLLRVLGLLIAGVLGIGTPLLLVRTILSVMLSSALVLWFWWRGIQQASAQLDDNPLLMIFRVGFGVLLVVLLFSVFYLDATYNVLFTALAEAIPIFFLSGLLALSFTRIALIQRENARYTSDNLQSASTRNWLLALTLSGLAVVLAVLALETFSFHAVVALIGLLWYIISIVLTWLVTLIAYVLTPVFYGLGWLFALLQHFFNSGHSFVAPTYPLQRSNSSRPQDFPPEAIAAGRFILLLLVLIALFFVVRAILRRVRTARKEDDVEEIREGLSLRSIVQQRRNAQQKSALPPAQPLEVLDTDSARAHYRELLQAIAANNPTLMRHTDETPLEYRTRLLTSVKQAATIQDGEATSEQEILDMLTGAYAVERYGGKSLEASQKSYLRTWVPRLIARFIHSK